MVLTEKQRNELHVSILEYLQSQGAAFAGSAHAFEADAGLEGSAPESKGLLEKKWTSVVRLQRKVMELEQKVEQLQSDLKNGIRPGREKGDGRCLPRAPPKCVLSGHRGPVTTVAVHPRYTILASGGEDAAIKVWDYDSGELERTLKGHTNAVQQIAFNPDGTVLCSCSADLSVKLWDFTDSYACVRTLRGHDQTISGVCWFPGAAELVSCSRDSTLKIWDALTGYVVRTLTGHSDWVRSVAVSADGGLIASAGSDKTVRVWSAKEGRLLHDLREHAHVVESVAFAGQTADKAIAACLGAANGPASSSAGAAAVGGSRENGNSEPNFSGASADADGAAGAASASRYLASASRDKTVKLWSVATGQCLMTFGDHENWVRCVVFHPTHALILSCSDDRSIRVFDIATGRCSRALEEAHGSFVTSLTVSNGSGGQIPVLASAGMDRNVHVWEMA